MKKQVYLSFVCVLLWSCDTVKQAQSTYQSISLEELIFIQAHSVGDNTSNVTQIYGCLKEKESNDPVVFGSIAVYKNDTLVIGTETDWDGHFSFELTDWDSIVNYSIEFGYLGFYHLRIDSLPLKQGFNYELNGFLVLAPIRIKHFGRWYYPPVYEADNLTSGQIFTSEQIKRRATGG